jgi:hypothetical protein
MSFRLENFILNYFLLGRSHLEQKLSGASILFLINRYVTPIQYIVILLGKSAVFSFVSIPY